MSGTDNEMQLSPIVYMQPFDIESEEILGKISVLMGR